MIHVDPDWWKTLFDEVYLITDAPFVCNPAVTKQEVDVVERLLALSPADRILICAVVKDAMLWSWPAVAISTSLCWIIRIFSCSVDSKKRLTSLCLWSFVRETLGPRPSPPGSFDVVLLMANSFGYFVDAADDGRVLTEVMRLLTPGGRVLLDLFDREVALQQFRPESWHEAKEDIVVCWKRELVQEVVRVREMVLSKRTGLLRDRTYAERLYSRDRIQALLHNAGFEEIETPWATLVYNPEGGTDYGLATDRMTVMAMKRA